MQIRSIYRGVRISAFKCREVTREIQGLPVGQALDILAFTPRKAARFVSKTLKSAIANAENNNSLRADRLVVLEAVVGEGTTIKRFRPKARGSAGTIRKRTSHIRITVTDEIEIPQGRKKSAGKKKGDSSKTSKLKVEEAAAIEVASEVFTPEAAAPAVENSEAAKN